MHLFKQGECALILPSTLIKYTKSFKFSKMWADIKAFVASRFCRNLEEVKDAIFEYKKTLTPEKCVRYISLFKK